MQTERVPLAGAVARDSDGSNASAGTSAPQSASPSVRSVLNACIERMEEARSRLVLDSVAAGRPTGRLELEMRLKRMQCGGGGGGSDVATEDGLSRFDYATLVNAFGAEVVAGSVRVDHSTTIDLMDESDARHTFDARTMAHLESLVKERVGGGSMPAATCSYRPKRPESLAPGARWLARRYEFALALARETRVERERLFRGKRAEFKLERVKERTSFLFFDGLLRLDVTRVQTRQLGYDPAEAASAMLVDDSGASAGDIGEVDASAASAEEANVSYECEIEYVYEPSLPAAHEICFDAAFMKIVADRVLVILALVSNALAAADAADEPIASDAANENGAAQQSSHVDQDAALINEPYIVPLDLGQRSDKTLAEHVLRRVRQLCALAAPTARDARRVERERSQFPGAMPVALRRQHLPMLRVERMLVGDKSNGLRLFLYVDRAAGSGSAAMARHETNVYFINRRCTVYRVYGAQALCAIASPDLLLDGELVLNMRSGRKNYLAFDILTPVTCAGEYRVARIPFVERLRRIAHYVVQPLREAAQRHAIDPVAQKSVASLNGRANNMSATSSSSSSRIVAPFMTFDVMGKQFWPLSHIDTLLQRIQRLNDAYYYVDARRTHSTDGLIFVSNDLGVRPFTCAPVMAHRLDGEDDASAAAAADPDARLRGGLFKWKYDDKRSIDLGLRTRPLRLCCTTGSGEAEFLRVEEPRFSSTDVARLARLRVGSIVECYFCADVGQWRFEGVRAKSEPNHLSVVTDTLLSGSEKISINELRALVYVQAMRSRVVSSLASADSSAPRAASFPAESMFRA